MGKVKTSNRKTKSVKTSNRKTESAKKPNRKTKSRRKPIYIGDPNVYDVDCCLSRRKRGIKVETHLVL